MNIQVIQHTSVPIARVTSDSILIFDVDSALDLMASVHYQSGARRLILDSSVFDGRFFDLKIVWPAIFCKSSSPIRRSWPLSGTFQCIRARA
jgi:hypothetical protein